LLVLACQACEEEHICYTGRRRLLLSFVLIAAGHRRCSSSLSHVTWNLAICYRCVKVSTLSYFPFCLYLIVVTLILIRCRRLLRLVMLLPWLFSSLLAKLVVAMLYSSSFCIFFISIVVAVRLLTSQFPTAAWTFSDNGMGRFMSASSPTGKRHT
jgi:hypothetical protein